MFVFPLHTEPAQDFSRHALVLPDLIQRDPAFKLKEVFLEFGLTWSAHSHLPHTFFVTGGQENLQRVLRFLSEAADPYLQQLSGWLKKSQIAAQMTLPSMKIGTCLFDFASGPFVMGILNLTADSFYDGGCHEDCETALAVAEKMIAEGADILDLGAESTRPGAKGIDEDEQILKIIPVIRALKKKSKIPISVDTRSAKVACEAIKAGADLINDVSGLKHDPEMAKVVARFSIPIVLNHMRGQPENMQQLADYRHVVLEVMEELNESLALALKARLAPELIIFDPGFGFAKSMADNLLLLEHLAAFKIMRAPLMVGLSRKSLVGQLLADSQKDRLLGSLLLEFYAAQQGCQFLRVHDVLQTKSMLKIWRGLKSSRCV